MTKDDRLATEDLSGVAGRVPSSQPMLLTAMQLLDAFTSEQRQRARLAFEDADRDNWDFLPASGRLGLPLRDPTHRQQILVHRLLGHLGYPGAPAKSSDFVGWGEGHVHDWRVEQVPSAIRAHHRG